MPTRGATKRNADTPDQIVADHPLRDAIDRARQVIREAVPSATESVKWNSPSFATSEHFATFFLRSKAGFQVVLHLGAKPKKGAAVRTQVEDPSGLLEWRDDDRAIVTFKDEADVSAKKDAFARVLRQWVAFVG